MIPADAWQAATRELLTAKQYRMIEALALRKVNGDLRRELPLPTTQNVWLNRAAKATGHPLEFLMRRQRSAPVVQARWQAWVWLHEQGLSKSEIGRMWNMDHTSVIHALRKHAGAL